MKDLGRLKCNHARQLRVERLCFLLTVELKGMDICGKIQNVQKNNRDDMYGHHTRKCGCDVYCVCPDDD